LVSLRVEDHAKVIEQFRVLIVYPARYWEVIPLHRLAYTKQA
jgi:hypothetical protein